MARVPCELGDIYTAAKLALVTAGIVSDSQCFTTLVPDDLLEEPPESPIISLSFIAYDHFLSSLSCEDTNLTPPTVEGELIVSIWIRLAVDQNMRDDEAVASAAYGFSPILSQILPVLNNVELVNPSGQGITWRTLTYLGKRNRGRWHRDQEWRRMDMRFDCCFEMIPESVTTTGNAILYDSDPTHVLSWGGGTLVYA